MRELERQPRTRSQEWLFSHPIHPGAAFLAEMLMPMAANPVFFTAPIFFGVAYTLQPSLGSVAAAVLIGLPVAGAASCVSKTAEIVCMLRLSPRTRGAVLGILSWLGYASLVLILILAGQRLLSPALRCLLPVANRLNPPLLRWALGVREDGSFSLTWAVLAGWAFASVVIAMCVWISSRSTRFGLARGFGETRVSPPIHHASMAGPLLRHPLYQKELLWFWRDRGAVVQAILIPLTIGILEAYNFRGLASLAEEGWHYLCGFGVIFGTYFLLVLGPRSLVSEGSALWITLTWPAGVTRRLARPGSRGGDPYRILWPL